MLIETGKVRVATIGLNKTNFGEFLWAQKTHPAPEKEEAYKRRLGMMMHCVTAFCYVHMLAHLIFALQNDSLATLLARLEGILGPVPEWMVQKGRYSSRFYTRR